MRNLASGSVILALVIIAGFGSPIFAQDEEVQVVPLERIIANPVAFRDMTVSFVVQFHEVGNIDMPYYTRFERNWFANFAVWPDSSKLWTRKGYLGDFRTMFVSRNKKAASTILSAPLYSRWVITGVVSDVFHGQAFIEVQGLQRLDAQLKTADLVHLVKGYRDRDAGRFESASRNFQSVTGGHLPTSIRNLAKNEVTLAANALKKQLDAAAREATERALADNSRKKTEKQADKKVTEKPSTDKPANKKTVTVETPERTGDLTPQM